MWAYDLALDSKGGIMKAMKLSQFFITMFLFCVLFCGMSKADESIFAGDSQSKWQKSLIKQGFYRSLGFYSGYYRYTEPTVMHIDTLMFGLIGQIGHISQGIKLEGTLRVNYALGLYTGGILDPDNPDRDGEKAYGMDGSVAGDIELKSGYNLLHSSNATLYLQTGLGYHLNRNEFISMDRIQGYFYVPLEIEGEALLNSKIAFTYGGGYRYLIFGNHLSTASKYGYTGDVRVTQKEGFGFSAFIGANFFNKARELRSFRLVYEYWNIGDSKSIRTESIYTGNEVYLYEPKNNTHRLFIQYSFGF